MTRPPGLIVGQRWRRRADGVLVEVEDTGGGYVTVRSPLRQSSMPIEYFNVAFDYVDAGAMLAPQLELDLGVYVPPTIEKGMTIQQRFEAFHAANPWVLRAFEQLVADWLGQGHRKVGMKMLAEVLRWQHSRRTTTQATGFKFDNNLTSRYARLLIERHPEWEQAFETRELRAS